MQHFLAGENLGLASIRINKESEFSGCFLVDTIAEARIADRFITYILPLYRYNKDNTNEGELPQRVPNLEPKLVAQLASHLGLTFTPEKTEGAGTFAPIDLLDYIYAVLHSPHYRETYKAFLKIDFPRVPFPADAARFWQLVALGGQLRQLHLLESPVVAQYITQYPVSGDNRVEDIQYAGGKVYINATQYFDKVPAVAWAFYIGGYQPAQKWLKDRKGRQLGYTDILHYQKIIVALAETDRLMKAIDAIGVV